MARTFIRQDAQVASTLTSLTGFVDNTAPASTMESGAANLADDLNNLRSMISYFNDLQTGNWYDPLTAPTALETGTVRGIQAIGEGLHAVEKKRVLRNVYSLVDVTVPASAAATQVLTGTANFGDTETVTIGSKTYTFQTTLTNVDGNVQIGASLNDSLQNLYDAINLTGTPGTQYAAAMTAHPTVTATANDATTLTVTAQTAGTGGNTIATTETAANASWGAATLAGGAGDIVILGTGELPTQTTAAVGAVTTLGTVVAAHAGTFGTFSLDEVAGNSAINPKNLMQIVDGATRDPILSSNRVVYGLLQGESGVTDGATITDTTTTRVQISFVRINATGDDLEAVPAADIGSEVINYATRERVRFEDLNEIDFLNGAVVDVPASITATRQVVYDNQGVTAVNVTTNSTLDLEGAGLTWTIRDDLEATLFQITEGSAGGTSTVALGSDVDTFDNNAVTNDFASGATLNSGGTRPIQVGVTDGVINSSAGDLRILGTVELFLDDGNQTGSTWAQTDGIKLSETTAEWDAFETAFGEVSLLSAITTAYSSQVRTKVAATLTANVSASNDINGPGTAHNNTDVDLAPYDAVGIANVDVYLNGELMRLTDDYIAGGTPADGDLQFTFNLSGTGAKPDQITMIVYGQ